MQTFKRRDLFRITAAAAVGTMAQQIHAQTCALTPAQMTGPFYPTRRRLDEDNDLTTISNRQGVATGQAIIITGRVFGEDCQPIAGSMVEIWQAGDNGRYDHPDDNSPQPLDPYFQYWGRATTDSDGSYIFKTIYPGLYGSRTRHIHFRVLAPRHKTLVTQLYFDGVPQNRRDGLYMALPPAQRPLITTTLTTDSVTGLATGVFDIYLGTSKKSTPTLE